MAQVNNPQGRHIRLAPNGGYLVRDSEIPNSPKKGATVVSGAVIGAVIPFMFTLETLLNVADFVFVNCIS